MSATNATVADLLRRYAAALVLEGADRFKVRAYRHAADTIETWSSDVGELVARGEDPKAIPGVGEAIGGAIQEIVQKGSMPQLDAILARTKPELVELSSRPALDPKRVLRIYKKLKIGSIAELRRCLDTGKIRDVFGPRMAFHIRQGLDERPAMLLYAAEPLAERIETFLKTIPGVTRVSRVGSLRRKKDTVGDLNFLIAAKSAAATFEGFSKYGAVRVVQRRTPDDAGFTLSSGVAVTLYWTRPEHWGVSLILRTGSVAHLADLEAYAAKKKLERLIASVQRPEFVAAEEKQVYRRLGLSFVEPELREGRGEVQAAANGSLPKLIVQKDLKGDLHMHTTASDGANSIAEMAEAARQRGYQYIAITDHSQSLKITNGLSEKRLLKQIKQIDAFNARQTGFVVLKSAEVDILEDGTLDYCDAVLKELDFTICSIHARFALNKEQQTARILRAMDNRYFTILGHATGRLLLRREGYELDMERVITHAKANACLFEINSSPDRLDLSDEHAKLAKDQGVKIAVNTDAHSIKELDFISAGINQARRAWLEATDVVNTFPLAQVLKLFRR